MKGLASKQKTENFFMKWLVEFKHYTLKSFLSQEFCLKLLNTLVLSQIQHLAIFWNGVSQNLIASIGKHLSWVVKACFNGNKSGSSSDLIIKHSIFPNA